MITAMLYEGFAQQLPDTDSTETQEWLDAFNDVVAVHGRTRARYLLMRLLERARSEQVGFPATVSTPYINTIPSDQEPAFPGDDYLERRIRAYIRWNAVAMVTRANHRSEGIGGHLATFASAAAIIDVGLNHFWRAASPGPDTDAGDLVFFQGHAAPGIYARAFLEGRLDAEDLDHFRREVGRYGTGLSSYPHPRLMPAFWQFPTVSMGLGPLNALYQARFNRYLHNRGLVDTARSRVWCMLGDGECDEPEALGALSLAGREGLDNLIFVVNCNLQRLDGPVRGNGKIIQELEAQFHGAGWNVVKVIWGSKWDELLARDTTGALLARMNETCDGEFQRYAVDPTGEYIRAHFFGKDPQLAAMVADKTDEELRSLPRGGHDYRKLYAAFAAASQPNGAPTVILAKTIKGWTLGPTVEARNATHQIKKLNPDELRAVRDRLYLGDVLSDDDLETDDPPYLSFAPDSAEHLYLMDRRAQLGGPVPARTVPDPGTALLPNPADSVFAEFAAGSGSLAVSTTMAFARLLRNLLRDPAVGRHIVPILADEGRTFGMDALFSEVQIYSPRGQRYEPVDAGLLLSYKESSSGQILQEGITEDGAMASFIAAGTAYSTWRTPMVPILPLYSMFGFQRTGDQIWAATDARAKGFILGATAGRTTLNGEGLQHQDGHSLLLASTVPAVAAYDPAFAYEVAALFRHGWQHMYGPDGADVVYYLTLYNENLVMPRQPDGLTDAAIAGGLYRYAAGPDVPDGRTATLLFSGSAWLNASRAAELLAERHGVSVELWSATSYKELRENAFRVERWNRLHPDYAPRIPRITAALARSQGPVVAVSDYMRAVPDQVSRWIPAGRAWLSLGTDGYGRSDTRAALREHFEISAEHIVVGVLTALARMGHARVSELQAAIEFYGLDADARDPSEPR